MEGQTRQRRGGAFGKGSTAWGVGLGEGLVVFAFPLFPCGEDLVFEFHLFEEIPIHRRLSEPVERLFELPRHLVREFLEVLKQGVGSQNLTICKGKGTSHLLLHFLSLNGGDASPKRPTSLDGRLGKTSAIAHRCMGQVERLVLGAQP